MVFSSFEKFIFFSKQFPNCFDLKSKNLSNAREKTFRLK